MASHLTDVTRRWTHLGEHDPMWAALTDPRRRRGGWDAAEFLRTGRVEIGAVLRTLAGLGVGPTMGTALDFGCGPGRLTAALAACGFDHAIGVDVSATMLATARDLVDDPRCEFRHNTGPQLNGVATDSVDLLYSCRVLQHMPPSLAHGYIAEFVRVVRPGGVAVFQIPAEPASGVAGSVLRRMPQKLSTRLRRGMQMHGTPPVEIVRVVAGAGGVTVSIDDDASAGTRWVSYLYVVQPAGLGSRESGSRQASDGQRSTGIDDALRTARY